MPIKINLLAEAQALDDLRRRDPVKRSIWISAGLVIVVLAWSTSLQLKAMFIKSEVNKIEGLLSSRTNEYKIVMGNQARLNEANRKLGSLQELATNRLLYGNLLNALQQVYVPDVQLMRLRADQSYLLTPEVKAHTNDEKVIPGRPATVTEKILLTLDAKDSGANPGDQVNKFKQAILKCPYFESALDKSNEVRLASLSPPQVSDTRPFVLFSLECHYPDKTR